MKGEVNIKSKHDRQPLPIIFRPPFFGVETATDYMSRVFEIHGYPWSSQHYKRVGVTRRGLLSRENGADVAIAKAIGLDATTIKCVTPDRVSSKEVHLCGEVIHYLQWTSERRRWCPACWRDDLKAEQGRNRPDFWNIHARFWWYVSPVTHCPFHRCKLRNECPACGAFAFSYVGSMLICKCGCSFADAPKEIVGEDEVACDSYILGRLGVLPRRRIPFLDQAQLGEAIDIVMHLGHAALGDPAISLKSYRGDRQHDLMKAGFAIAEDWPRKFVVLLDSRSEPGSGWGGDQKFGHLFRWVKTLKSGKGNDELKRVMLQYVADTTVTKRTAKAGNYQNRRQGTVTSLARELGISIAKCRLYLTAVGSPVGRSGSGRTNLVNEAARQAVLALFDGRINLTQVQERLGVGKKVTKEVVAEKLLIEDPIHKKASKSAKMFKEAEVDTFLARMGEGLAEVANIDPASDLKPLPQAAQFCRGINTAKACTLVLEGRLKCQARLKGDKTLSGLLTTPNDLKDAAVEDRT